MTAHSHKLDHSLTQSQLWPILRVLSWEFVRCVNVPGLFLGLACLLLPWALFNATMGLSQDAFQAENYYPSFFALTSFFGLVMVQKGQQGVRRFLVTRPLTNPFMFAWLLLTPVACVLLVFLASNVVVQVAYGLDWPWGRPMLWLAFFVILTKCAYWRVMVGWDWEVLGAIGVGVLAAGCFAMVQGVFDSKIIELHRPFTAIEVSLLGLATLVTLVVGYRSLCEIRVSCGDVDGETWYAERYGKLDAAFIQLASASAKRRATPSKVPESLASLSNGRAALDWIAWRQVGAVGIFINVVAGLLLMAPQAVKSIDFSKFPPTLAAFHGAGLIDFTVPMFTVVCAETGTAIGFLAAFMMRTPFVERSSSMSAFHAMKPVGTAELYGVLSRAMFRYCVMAWGLLCAVAWVLPITVYFSIEPAPPGGSYHLGAFMHAFQSNSFYEILGPWSLVAWMLFGLLVMWVFAGLMSTGVLFGSDKVASFVAAVVVGYMVVVLFLTLMIPDHKTTIITVAWTIGGLFSLGATLWGCHRTWRNGMLGGQQLLFAVCSWVLLGAFAIYLTEPAHAAGAVMLSSLIGLGVVTGPTALAASRHR